MKKIIALIIALFLFGANVTSVKKEIKNTKITISKMNIYLAKLAREIRKKESEIKKINLKIQNLNRQIEKLKNELQNSNEALNELYDLKKGYLEKLKEIQDKINYFLSTNYYISTKSAENINDLIRQEVTKEILKIYSNKISFFTKEQTIIKSKIDEISNKISKVIENQKLLTKKRNQLLALKKKREKELNLLRAKKEIYKKKLYAMIKKQKTLQNKLKELSIIKTTKHEAENLPIKIYKGIKTIAPVNGKVIKHFGSYIDPIYKFKVYNDSITIKPYRKNAVIKAIMPGRIVYIDRKKGVVIIKHKNYLFSIYANLSKISPIIKKGTYVKRGQIIARVENSLEFEITYKDRPINPLRVISLK